MNVFSFVQWNKYFHSVKDKMLHSARFRLVKWNISSFTSWKYLYHCTDKHSLFVYHTVPYWKVKTLIFTFHYFLTSYLQAVCCDDQTHCCPEGYTCETQGGYCSKSSSLISIGIQLSFQFCSVSRWSVSMSWWQHMLLTRQWSVWVLSTTKCCVLFRWAPLLSKWLHL